MQKNLFFRNRVRNRLLIDYAPRFRGSGHERRHVHRIDAAKHMTVAARTGSARRARASSMLRPP